MLDLVEDVARDDGEDPARAPAALKLGQKHRDFDRLAEPDGVGDQQTRLQLRHRRAEGLALERQVVCEHRLAHREIRVGDRQRSAAHHRLEH